MTIDDQIKDEKIQYDINIEAVKKYLHYHQEKLTTTNMLLVKKYYLLIKNK